MDGLTDLLTTLNTLSPLAVIGLLAAIIFMQVRNRTEANAHVAHLQSNDLHELPEIAETLRRIEVSMTENFAYIKARINGGSHR